MAWGDLRFDHSDIFSPSLEQRRTQRKERASERPKRPIREGSTWDRILKMLATGPMTTADIRLQLGMTKPNGNIQRLLELMVDAGVIGRARESVGTRGQKPFMYHKI